MSDNAASLLGTPPRAARLSNVSSTPGPDARLRSTCTPAWHNFQKPPPADSLHHLICTTAVAHQVGCPISWSALSMQTEHVAHLNTAQQLCAPRSAVQPCTVQTSVHSSWCLPLRPVLQVRAGSTALMAASTCGAAPLAATPSLPTQSPQQITCQAHLGRCRCEATPDNHDGVTTLAYLKLDSAGAPYTVQLHVNQAHATNHISSQPMSNGVRYM
jgi:hypothetical protein